MNSPRTLLATIGATAAGFALVLSSVIFTAASGSSLPATATTTVTREAASTQPLVTERYAMQFDAATGDPC